MIIRSVGVDQFKQHAASHPMIGRHGGANSHVQHPVCPACEKIALRDKGWSQNRKARCPACGWTGRATKLLNEYIEDQMYRR